MLGSGLGLRIVLGCKVDKTPLGGFGAHGASDGTFGNLLLARGPWGGGGAGVVGILAPAESPPPPPPGRST